MVRYHVGGKVVHEVDLLKPMHWTWRLDIWPFAVFYFIWFLVVVPNINFGNAFIIFGGFVTLHILVLLFIAWTVNFRCLVQFRKETYGGHLRLPYHSPYSMVGPFGPFSTGGSVALTCPMQPTTGCPIVFESGFHEAVLGTTSRKQGVSSKGALSRSTKSSLCKRQGWVYGA